MRALERRTIALALALAGCTARTEASGVAPGATSTSVGPTLTWLATVPPRSPTAAVLESPFRVALVEADPAGGAPFHRAEPCLVRGRTLICDDASPLVSGEDGIDADATLAGAMGEGSATPVTGEVRNVVGRWPDDAWMLTYDRDSKAGRRGAYRWKDGRWRKLGAWDGAPRWVARWRDGLIVDAAGDADDERAPGEPWRAPLSWVGADGARKSAPASPLVAGRATGSGRTWPEVDHVASADGVLFVVAGSERPARLMVERWLPDGARMAPYELAPRPARAHLWTRTAQDVVAFGGATNADDRPVLSHFDGQGWAPIEPPPGVDVIVAYDRSAAGTERVFAFRGLELSLWERASGAAWRSVALPALAAGESIDGHWLTDDDAWLHVRATDGPGRLLRLRPVKHVYRMGATPAIEPVPAEAAGLFAASAAASHAAVPASPRDPSPFHDAVVSYLDPPEAMLPNALRVCPFHGRTFVCGVSDAPLVSTPDGVVSDEAAEARIASGRASPLTGDVVGAFGAWPDDAWIVTARPGTTETRAYRREADAWVPFATWEGPLGQTVARSAGDLLVAPMVVSSHDAARTYPLGAARAGARRLAVSSTRVVGPRETSWPPVSGLASAGDALFVAAVHDGKLAVERRLAGGSRGVRVDAVAEADANDPAGADVALWAVSADDAVLFGRLGHGAKTPVLRRFDGQAWSATATPPGIDRVAAYDRTSTGVDRVFAYTGETLGLFERQPGAARDRADAWQSVPLPALAPGDRIHDVWLANDDAWLLVWPKDTTKDAPHLMRTQPVRRVWTYPRRLPDDLGW
jgi:hypothetical protein